jgi:two-component system sensor histidine kinase PilS (NtrC family)
MQSFASRGGLPRARGISTFLSLRAIFLTLCVGAGIIIVQLTQGSVAVGPLYVLLLVGYAAGAVVSLGLRFGVPFVPLLWSLMVTDVLIETAIVHYSGGATSQFSLVFCLSIIAAAALLQMHGGLGIAVLASACYAGYGAAEMNGLLPATAAAVPEAPEAGFFVRVYMHVSLFFVVGAIAGYFSQHVRRRGHQLESAESKLKQLRLDTEQILEDMSSGVLVADSRGKILVTNPAAEQILGVDKNDVVELQIEAAFEALMPEFAREVLAALERGQGKSRHEITVRRHNGSLLPLGLSTSILKDDAGATRGVIAVFQDLTEVRRMEERMRKADRLAAIGELSAGIAHELRNPLASISGSIEMLSNELKLAGDSRRLMDLIIKESDRLNKIISDFLEFARLRPPKRRVVSLRKCIEEVLPLIANDPSLKTGIETEVRHKDGDIIAEIDEEQIKQVIWNLTLNAYEAMKGRGTLVIETSREPEGAARIAFQDRGPGLDGGVKTRLFEPFFTTKEGGTGLGLAIANKIVEAHGGKIEARNRERSGAEFSVVLPVRTEPRPGGPLEALSSVGSVGS